MSFDDDMMMSEDLANSGEKIRKNDIMSGEFLVENVKNIGSKELNYRKYFINDFFAVDFVEKFLEKYNKANLSLKNLNSGGIMSGEKQGEKVNLNEFLNDKGEVDYTKMGSIDTLPQTRKYKSFVDDFVNDESAKNIKANKIVFQTPAGEIKIYLPYAYGHFYKNGKFGNKKENRNNLTGALKSILKNPLFVAKDKQGALYFYKPFKDKDGIADMISVSVDKDGKIQYKTSYADKYNQIANLMNNFEIIYKRELGLG